MCTEAQYKIPASKTVMVSSSRNNIHLEDLINFVINLEQNIEISDDENKYGDFSAEVDRCGPQKKYIFDQLSYNNNVPAEDVYMKLKGLQYKKLKA